MIDHHMQQDYISQRLQLQGFARVPGVEMKSSLPESALLEWPEFAASSMPMRYLQLRFSVNLPSRIIKVVITTH